MADIVRASTLWGYSALVQSIGGDADALIVRAGLTPGELTNPDHFVPRKSTLDLLEATAETLACPDFGLRLAAIQDVNVLGPLAFAIRNAPDVGGALGAAARHLHTQAPEASMTMETLDGGAARRIVFQAGDDFLRPAPQGREHVIGLIVRLIDLVTGGAVRPSGVHFRHEPVSSIATYAARLRLAPDFGMDADAVLLRARDLAAPLGPADRPLQAIIERYLGSYAPSTDERFTQRVRRVLSRLVRESSTSMADAAEILGLHPRTLQRRLAAEGTSYEQLRDEIRRDLAELYLAHDDMPIAQAAHLLGYADQSVLTRSCVRWFGKTPRAIRRGRSGPADGKLRGGKQASGAAD